MIKHLILLNKKDDESTVSGVISAKNGYCYQIIEVGNKKYFEFYLGHNGTINKFSFPLSKENILSISGDLTDTNKVNPVVGKGNPNIIKLIPLEDFYLPSKTIGDGMISSIKVETEGMIVPGRYGFTLVKKNVGFNERNKWYVEIIIKEDTSYSDFASILDSKFKEINENLGVSWENGYFDVDNDFGLEEYPIYTITLDELASYAFTVEHRYPDDNNRFPFVSQLRKLAYECDADYGFDYTNTGGENLYKVNREELFNQLLDVWNTNDIDMVSIKVFEPSLYRTLDPRINQSYTFIGFRDYMGGLLSTLNEAINGIR